MDIKPSINRPGQSAPTKPADPLLNLKLGQTLNVKVISATAETEKTTITLKLADKHITLQSSQPLKLDPGQTLQIQVSKTTPVLEFKIIHSALQPKLQTVLLSLQEKTAAQTLSSSKIEEQSLVLKQQLLAKITALVGNKIQLQVLSSHPPSQYQNKGIETANQPFLLTIERSQLKTEHAQQLNEAEPLQIGQLLKLEVTRTGTSPAFKIWPAEGAGAAEKITELLKQFLPRHQSAAVLLNHLMKDLPELIQHESLPQALKDSILNILQNLPQKQQLLTSLGIKQATNSSGLFLEARLEQATTTSQSALYEELNIDFKANLLKLIQLLKQEVMSAQAVQNHRQAELALLKDLQQKTENTIARIVLDQLLSLPKDDNPKQIWHLELPFVDREITETVNLEINQDKDSGQHPDSGNWSVNITLTPPGLGTIHCAICYRDHTINAHFRSQETQTTTLIKHNLDYLKTQLEQSGLSIGHMNAEDERQKIPAPYPPAEAKLFDDKA